MEGPDNKELSLPRRRRYCYPSADFGLALQFNAG